MAITKKDIEKLSEVFATKDDLKNFATKADFNSLKLDLENLKSEYLDKIMKGIEDLKLEQKMSYAQYRRHDEKLENHESRIHALEVKV